MVNWGKHKRHMGKHGHTKHVPDSLLCLLTCMPACMLDAMMASNLNMHVFFLYIRVATRRNFSSLFLSYLFTFCFDNFICCVVAFIVNIAMLYIHIYMTGCVCVCKIYFCISAAVVYSFILSLSMSRLRWNCVRVLKPKTAEILFETRFMPFFSLHKHIACAHICCSSLPVFTR